MYGIYGSEVYGKWGMGEIWVIVPIFLRTKLGSLEMYGV
jgi:hypothetical protein